LRTLTLSVSENERGQPPMGLTHTLTLRPLPAVNGTGERVFDPHPPS